MAANANESIFTSRPERYQLMVNWQRRLKNESDFYRQWFDKVQADRILDVACGTGEHAAMFHSWGKTIEASDISDEMIRFCREKHGQDDRLQWISRSYNQRTTNSEPFDVAMCVGNSLAMAADRNQVAHAIDVMMASVRVGGLIIVQVLNVWQFEEGPIVWQKVQKLDADGAEVLLLKGVHRVGDVGHIDLLEVNLSTDDLQRYETHGTMLGLTCDDFRQFVKQAGGGEPTFFGGYHDEPYEPTSSQDLIMVCRRES